MAARLIAAHFTGDTELTSELSKEIATRYSAFASDPAVTFPKGKNPSKLTKSLTKALRAASFEHQSEPQGLFARIFCRTKFAYLLLIQCFAFLYFEFTTFREFVFKSFEQR